jgi:hypothetical protein
LAKSVTAKSWGEEPQSDGLAAERRTAKREINPGAHRDAATAPWKMILLSMILLKNSPLKSKPVHESQKANLLKPVSNISKI